MNKKLFALAALFCSLALLFASCGNDEDNQIDEVWKSFHEQEISKIKNNSDYQSLVSESQNGSVYWRYIDFITEEDESARLGKSPKMTDLGTPEFSDSVVVRYKTWYYDADRDDYLIDSTEGDENAQTGRGCRVDASRNLGGLPVIDGLATMLQQMKVGDEVEVCIPYQLAYGVGGLTIGRTTVVPPYTSIWYKIKLLKILR